MRSMIGRRTMMGSALALAAGNAVAQDNWPGHAITLVNGYPPGGVTDTATRMLAERFGRELAQTIVVENRAGGATSIASTAVAQAKPDGYTLLMGAATLAINPALQPGLTPREPMKELAPIAMGYRSAFVLHVHPSVPVKTVPELIAYAKANPGKLNFGSSGTGAVNHLALELLRARAGIDIVHVPYRGGVPALLDLRTGRIQAMFSAALEALPPVKEGVTRAIAVSSAERVALLPEVPTVAETLPGFDAVFWQGLFAPAGTPAAVIRKSEAAMLVATRDQGLSARLAEQGVAVAPGDAAYLAKYLADETAMWGKLIREANIKAE